jgi:protein subunit release factor B
VKFPADAPVRPEKLEELRARISALGLKLDEVEEQFTRGGGRGGQKLQKTSSAVRLAYRGLHVRCARERSRAINRFIALRTLVEKLERAVRARARPPPQP